MIKTTSIIERCLSDAGLESLLVGRKIVDTSRSSTLRLYIDDRLHSVEIEDRVEWGIEELDNGEEVRSILYKTYIFNVVINEEYFNQEITKVDFQTIGEQKERWFVYAGDNIVVSFDVSFPEFRSSGSITLRHRIQEDVNQDHYGLWVSYDSSPSRGQIFLEAYNPQDNPETGLKYYFTDADFSEKYIDGLIDYGKRYTTDDPDLKHILPSGAITWVNKIVEDLANSFKDTPNN